MSKSGQENHSNYTDGIKVKISEKYKPPPRINLAMTYSQRISLNKQLQDNMPVYDFTLEATIKEKMKEWRMARNLIALDHKDKLDRIKEERRKQAEEILKGEEQLKLEQTSELAKQRILNENDINQISNLDTKQNYTSGGVLIPTQVPTNNFGNILTPIPLSSQASMSKSNEKSPINISDFEPDTCSPFDKVELNTINDLEELKLVLQNDDNNRTNVTQANYAVGNNVQVQSYQPRLESQMKYYGYSVAHGSNQSYPITSVYSNGFNYYPPDTLHPVAYNTYNYNNPVKSEYSSSFDAQTPSVTVDDNKLPFRSVPDIMKALQSELSNTRISNINIPSHSSITNASPSDGGNIEDTLISENLENPFEQLPKNKQDICKQISSMGFPLGRVARACQDVGDDVKKIIEHLLVMRQLLDLGFSEKNVSSALLQCNNDRDKALELLIS